MASGNHGERTTSRSLADVRLHSEGAGGGTCLIRDVLTSSSNGDIVETFGIAFSIKAISPAVDVVGIEFAVGTGFKDGTPVKVYAKKGADISNNVADWIQLASTKARLTADGKGAIVPRADMSRPIALTDSEEWAILVAFESSGIQLLDTSGAVGSQGSLDSILRINVGHSIDASRDNAFDAPRTPNRGFQGKLHHRILKSCNTLVEQTTLKYKFAVNADAGSDSAISTALTSGFTRMITTESDLERYSNLEGLQFSHLSLDSKGAASNCVKLGLEVGCKLYEGSVVFDRYASLDDRELILAFLQKLQGESDILGDDTIAVYAGDEIFEENFAMKLSGLPFGTVLNPIQRDYLGQVINDFVEQSSDAVPFRVSVSQDARRRLRGRNLQNRGSVEGEVLIHGIGKERNVFFSELKKTLDRKDDLLLKQIVTQQYRPGEINSRQNFGEVFENLSEAKFTSLRAGEVTSGGSGNSEASDSGLDSTQIQIIAFSVAIALSVIWIVYRVLKDCILVQDGYGIEKVKLSEKNQDSKRPELDNMDRPRQRLTVKVGPLPELDFPKKDVSTDNLDNSSMSSHARRGRKPPATRGVRRARTSEGDDLLGTLPEGKIDHSGLGQISNKRVSNGSIGINASNHSCASGSTATSLSQNGKPRSVPRRARSNEDIGLMGQTLGPSKNGSGLAQSAHMEPTRGLGRSKSGDSLRKNGAMSNTPIGLPRPPPERRGVKKANTFSGATGFYGSETPTSNASTCGSKTGSTKKKRSESSKTSSNGVDTGIGKSKKKQTKAKTSKSDLSAKSKKAKGKRCGKKPPRRVDMAGHLE